MADTYEVVADLALIRRRNGASDYCYKGTLAPQDAVDGEIERLVSEGYLAKVEPPVEPLRLTATSSKADWAAYDVAQRVAAGEPEADAKAAAEKSTRDELVKKYLAPSSN